VDKVQPFGLRHRTFALKRLLFFLLFEFLAASSEEFKFKGNFEMEHTISRNNAQYKFCTVCALLRNVWGWVQAEIAA
jgi:hypothetical protein